MLKCFACENSIPDGANECPACHLQVARCRNQACGECYPAEANFCPYCGEAAENVATGPTVVREPPAETSQGAADDGQPSAYDRMLALFQDGASSNSTPASQSAMNHVVEPDAASGRAVAANPRLPFLESPGGVLAGTGRPTDVGAAPVAAIGAAGLCAPRLGMAGSPVPATDLTGLAMPGAVAGATPVTLEVETSNKFRRHQQGLLRIRVRGDALPSEVLVELKVESELIPSTVSSQTRLGPVETHEFNPVRFVPSVAGTEHVRLSLTLKTPANSPLGRWLATWLIQIEDVQKQEIHAGGDVFIVGGVAGAAPPFGLDAEFGLAVGGWQPLVMQPDRAFNRRLAKACPETAESAPSSVDPCSAWPRGARAQAAVFVEDRQTGLIQALAVVCGNSASVGRGGDPAVAWWLQPSPYDSSQHNRLSRRHFSLELRDGRAWVADWSTNGTWLNAERIVKSDLCLLADEDRLDPAQVVPFKVGLLAAQGQVRAVRLWRADALGEQLTYVLTDGAVPLPVLLPGQVEPAVWLTWRRTASGGPELLVACGAGEDWIPIAPQQQRVFSDRYGVAWQLLPAPVEQTKYLEPLRTPM